MDALLRRKSRSKDKNKAPQGDDGEPTLSKEPPTTRGSSARPSRSSSRKSASVSSLGDDKSQQVTDITCTVYNFSTMFIPSNYIPAI